MARLKNRRIRGLNKGYSVFTEKQEIRINFGENRYGTCTIKEFFKNVSSWKLVDDNGTRGGERVIHLLSNTDQLKSHMFNNGVQDLLAKAEHLVNIREEVVNLSIGSYLLELDDFIPLRNGKTTYSKISTHRGYQIKFHNNGVYGFTIFKGATASEDRIWSIARCKEIIEEMISCK